MLICFSSQVYPFVGYHRLKFYWGHKEVLIPVYKSISDAIKKHTDADCLINFASLRSAKESTDDAIRCPQIRTIAIIAEGIPENVTRKINKAAKQRGSLAEVERYEVDEIRRILGYEY